MATLTELRTEVLETAGLASDDARFPSATLDRIIRRAVRQIESEHDWPWLEASETLTTAADTEAYSPAAGWFKTLRLLYEDRDLVEYQPRDAQKYQSDTGRPVGFYIEEDQIHFVPVPDGVYSVTHVYQKSLVTADLDADGESPDIPDRYIDWIVSVALIQVAQRIRDEVLYSIADRERRRWFERASDEMRRSAGTVAPRSRGDWRI